MAETLKFDSRLFAQLSKPSSLRGADTFTRYLLRASTVSSSDVLFSPFYVKMLSSVSYLKYPHNDCQVFSSCECSRIRAQQVVGHSEHISAVKLLRRTLVKTHTTTAIVGVSAPDSQGWPEQLVVK